MPNTRSGQSSRCNNPILLVTNVTSGHATHANGPPFTTVVPIIVMFFIVTIPYADALFKMILI